MPKACLRLANPAAVSEAVSDWAILAVHLGPPLPSCRGSQNGPRREGFASPRNAGAPLTAAGRSERTPPSKRERGRVKSNQTTAVLAPFSTAIDKEKMILLPVGRSPVLLFDPAMYIRCSRDKVLLVGRV